MAQTTGLAKLIELLLSRPETRSLGRRAIEGAAAGGGGIGVSKQLNAPRMITVLIAFALTLLGLSLTIWEITFITDLLADQDLELTRDHGYMALTASPLLIIAGSVFRGL